MATIRIPIADEQIQTPSPGAGQVRTRRQAALRESGAGQLPAGLGQMDTRAANIDVGAAGALGQAGQRAGTALDQFAEAEAKMRDETDLRAARVSLSRRLGEIEVDFQGRDLRDSGAAATEYNRVAGEARDEIGQNLGGRARQLWASTADELILPREFNVRRDAFQRNAQAAVATLQDDLRSNANFAAASRNPAERETYLREGQAAIEGAVSAGFMNPEAAGRLARGFRSDVQMADVNRLMGSNPGAAIRLLNDLSATPDIDADRRGGLVTAAMQRQAAIATQAEAVANRQERAASRAFNEWNLLAAAGQVPEDRAAATLAIARGTSIEPIVRQAMADSRLTGEFRAAPPARQNTMIAEVQARVEGGSANDRDLALLQRLAQTQDQQRRGYAQDGWMQGVRDGLISRGDIPPPLNLSDPNSIMARFALSDRLAAMGRPGVPVFSAAETTELTRQLTQAQANPQQLVQSLAAIQAIPDERIRTQTFRQLDAALGDGGRSERGTYSIIAQAAAGSPAQQRAAVQMAQAITVDRSERVRRLGEGAELRTAMEEALRDPRLASAQAASRAGRDQSVEFNARLGIIRDAAAGFMAAGEAPDRAVQRALGTAFPDELSVYQPGMARVRYDRNLGLGEPDAVAASLRALRGQFVSSIPRDPALGAEVVARNSQMARAAGNAEWVTLAPGRFGLVGRGDQGDVLMFEITADQIKAQSTAAQRQRTIESAPRPPGAQRTGRMIPAPAPGLQAPPEVQ